MEKIEYGNELIKDTKVLHLSTQTTSSILLNDSYKSKVSYDVRGYLNLENDDSIEYVTLQMPYAVICNSNYIVNEYNNTLEVTLGITTTKYSLTQGNYSLTTFTALLQTLLTTANGWTITSNATTNKYTFANSASTNFTFTSNTTCDYIIGFSGNQSTTTGTLTMPRTYNFLPIPRFIIRCNLLSDGIILGVNSNVAGSDVLASIPNVSRNNGLITYENNASEFLVKNLALGLITISITDDNGRLINFNGVSSYFVLKFNIFRKYIKKPMRFDNLVDYINKVPVSLSNVEQEESLVE
jgi:hypothetical protein